MTKPLKQDRPKKPSKNFPLTASGDGSWVKVIGGKKHRFGRWSDPRGALDNYKKQFSYGNEYLETSVRYTDALASPAKRLTRERRNEIGAKMLTAPEIRALIDKASDELKAIIFLGINAGFHSSDCIELTVDKIKGTFIDFPRPKTTVQRRCPLWKETLDAINTIASDTHMLHGKIWNRHVIARDFRELCEECKIYRKGITEPSALRRTFQTIAKCSPVNQSVVDRSFGHERAAMSEVYNQKVFDSSLVTCVTFVYDWLHGKIKL